MIDLLNQIATLSSDPVLDMFAQSTSWTTIKQIKCRFVNKKRFGMDANHQIIKLEAEITTKEELKLGDNINIQGSDYEVYSVDEWRDMDTIFGYKAALIRV